VQLCAVVCRVVCRLCATVTLLVKRSLFILTIDCTQLFLKSLKKIKKVKKILNIRKSCVQRVSQNLTNAVINSV